MSADYVHVKPRETDPKKSKYATVTGIKLSVNYHKGRGIVLSAYPSYETSGTVAIIITNGEYITLEKCDRLNRKKVDSHRKSVQEGIASQHGPVWDLINKVCERCGLEVCIF